MNRREWLAGAMTMLCIGAEALAQADRARRIGWLDFSSSTKNLETFEQAMAALGWTKGKDFTVDYRGGEGRSARAAILAAELVRLPVDVIVAAGTPEALAARDATKTIPIVMAGVEDPVIQKLVVSLARPGRNITGVASSRRALDEKVLSLVRQLGPPASRLAILIDPTDPEHRVIVGNLRAAARTMKLSPNVVEVQQYLEVEPAFAAMKRQGSKVLVVPPSSMFVPRWIADLAVTHGLALVSMSPAYVYEGGVLACSDDRSAVFARAATYVDRILKGAKPGDLPVEVPAKCKLTVNRKAAQALKLTLPQSILLEADVVID